ncbi:MAG: DUF4179 domain-containing protein [Lachnospiraceae bacterium]|nr:DUF4179 domain-containing protein [Lachnospiraceae bacterium]
MMQNISDETLQNILGTTLSKSAVIDAKTKEAYAMIRQAGRKKAGVIKYKKKRKRKRIFTGIVSAAAVLFLTCVICVMNPVLAKEIPILGELFQKVADVFTYGDIPVENTEHLYETDTAPQYQKADSGIKVTLTEEYASNQAVYIGIRIENAEEFPELVTMIESGAQFLEVRTQETYSFRPEPIVTRRRIEGKFEDAHTFIGVLRIDYSELIIDYGRYDAAVAEADEKGEEYPEFTLEEWADYYDMPASFDMTLEVKQIIGTLENPVYPDDMTPEEKRVYPNPYKHWYCEGNWLFEIPVTQSADAGRLISLNQVNEEGFGIESIELSPVEMTVKDILPADDQGIVTWILAFDADGEEIRGTDSGNVFAVAGHDVSTITFYICEFEKVEESRIEYENPQNQKTYQEIAGEYAFMKIIADTEE